MAYMITEEESLPDACREDFKFSIDNTSESSVSDEITSSKHKPEESISKELNNRPYECSNRPMALKTQTGFYHHMNIQKGGFLCDLCYTYYESESNLEAHLEAHINGETLKCRICFKTFRHKNSLYKHMKLHDEQNPNKCMLCNTLWRTKYELERHMLKHSDERPHKCIFCPSKFKHKHKLKIHMKIHDHLDH